MIPEGWIKIMSRKRLSSIFKHISWISKHYNMLKSIGVESEGFEKALVSLHEEARLLFKKAVEGEEE